MLVWVITVVYIVFVRWRQVWLGVTSHVSLLNYCLLKNKIDRFILTDGDRFTLRLSLRYSRVQKITWPSRDLTFHLMALTTKLHSLWKKIWARNCVLEHKPHLREFFDILKPIIYCSNFLSCCFTCLKVTILICILPFNLILLSKSLCCIFYAYIYS